MDSSTFLLNLKLIGTDNRAVFINLVTKAGEPNTKKVSGVLIGSPNTQRTRAPSYWFICRTNRILHTANKVPFHEACKSFVFEQTNSSPKSVAVFFFLCIGRSKADPGGWNG